MTNETEYRGHRGAIPWKLIGWGTALAAILLTIWVNGAVGMIGDEGNPYNFVFLGVIAVALLGAILARFRTDGMIRAMGVAAVAQFMAGAYGLTTDVRGGIFSALFAGLWLLAALLFAKAARDQGSTSTAT